MDSHMDKQADMTKSFFGILQMCLKLRLLDNKVMKGILVPKIGQ
jgi:hypothetical protein